MNAKVAGLLPPLGVTSAGLLEGGRASPPEVVELMAAIGADLGERTSRQVSTDDVDRCDLVLTMERLHLREVAVMAPYAWGKIFTLKELVRRGAAAGGWMRGEAVEDWIARLHDGRETTDLLGASPSDDVDDPYGGSPEQYAATKVELADLTAQLAELIFEQPPPVPRPEVAAVISDEKPPRSRFSIVRRGQ